MLRTLLLSALAMLGLAASAQATTKITATKANEYGIVYTLPTTVLDIVIETEYTQQQPGEFCNYAGHSLNLQNVIRQPMQTATVKSVTIVPRGVSNPDSRYLMQLKSGQTMFVMLNDADVPVAINIEDVPSAKEAVLPVAKKAEPTPLETPAAQQAITQEMTVSFNQSKKAQLAAERIFELRENRNDLISGQAENTPPDGRAMQLALDNLSAQEAALTAMFAGTTRTWTEVNTITFTPDTAEVANKVLARVSPTAGLVDSEDLSGAPIYLTVKINSRGEMPTDEKGNPRPFPKNGVAYQIPGTATITITFDGKQIASTQVELAQLGFAYGVDPKVFTDKKNPGYAIFNPVTGGIVTLGIK